MNGARRVGPAGKDVPPVLHLLPDTSSGWEHDPADEQARFLLAPPSDADDFLQRSGGLRAGDGWNARPTSKRTMRGGAGLFLARAASSSTPGCTPRPAP